MATATIATTPKNNSNHLSVHQWIRSAIHKSQQPTSPIGFMFLKFPPPPCAVLLVFRLITPTVPPQIAKRRQWCWACPCISIMSHTQKLVALWLLGIQWLNCRFGPPVTDNSDQLQVELCSRGVEALELQVWRTTRASQVSQRSWAQWWLWRSGCYEHRPTLNIHWRHDLLRAQHVCRAVDGILPRNSFIYMKL